MQHRFYGSMVLAVLALAVPWATPSQARAQETSPADAIEQIREQVLYAQYGEAVTALEGYLERTDLDAAERNAGLEVLATIQIARRQRRRSRTTLTTLFHRLRPGCRRRSR
ncbi:MAG: hypothetical protein JRH11_04105 [Deltaproteobacteria bacterium]|nr:hypothetical protein [Deltaproteobacteria bacterium]